jgi:hypothetical protein
MEVVSPRTAQEFKRARVQDEAGDFPPPKRMKMTIVEEDEDAIYAAEFAAEVELALNSELAPESPEQQFPYLRAGEMPSPPIKAPAHYWTVHSVYDQLFKLEDKIISGDMQYEHYEELDGIAQNIIDLDLNFTDLLIVTRESFNAHWEILGCDYNNFKMLYDCCCETLARHLNYV